jgi:hypothetical protein
VIQVERMSQAPPKTGDALPNQTLYVNNINEKIRKDGE